MRVSQDTGLDGIKSSALSLSDISENFISFIREEAQAFRSNVAFVADTSQVSGRKVDGSERYVVVVLPDIDSLAVPKRKARIHAEIRRTSCGSSVACAMFAERMVEVAASIVGEAFPLFLGRLNVLWVFKDGVALDSHHYTEDLEQDFSNAASVANAHQHKQAPHDAPDERTAVKVHTGWVLGGIRPVGWQATTD